MICLHWVSFLCTVVKCCHFLQAKLLSFFFLSLIVHLSWCLLTALSVSFAPSKVYIQANSSGDHSASADLSINLWLTVCKDQILNASWMLRNCPFLYCRLSYGNESGLVIVDYIAKTCILNMGTPELYGSADPYQRVPRSPKRNESNKEDERCRSPSSDQVIAKGIGMCLFYLIIFFIYLCSFTMIYLSRFAIM